MVSIRLLLLGTMSSASSAGILVGYLPGMPAVRQVSATNSAPGPTGTPGPSPPLPPAPPIPDTQVDVEVRDRCNNLKLAGAFFYTCCLDQEQYMLNLSDVLGNDNGELVPANNGGMGATCHRCEIKNGDAQITVSCRCVKMDGTNQEANFDLNRILAYRDLPDWEKGLSFKGNIGKKALTPSYGCVP